MNASPEIWHQQEFFVSLLGAEIEWDDIAGNSNEPLVECFDGIERPDLRHGVGRAAFRNVPSPTFGANRRIISFVELEDPLLLSLGHQLFPGQFKWLGLRFLCLC